MKGDEEPCPPEGPWPEGGLERQDRCPICRDPEREVRYADLRDRVFFCAPGTWTLYRCRGCRTGYLDPRPTPETIGLAYRRYFTHAAALDAFETLGWRGRVKRRLANGYRKHRFGSRVRPASRLGPVAAWLLPRERARIVAEGRHLPRAARGRRLLDIGCGNGSFLKLAAQSGWDVLGVDFDAKAVEVARSRGLEVRQGSLDVLNPDVERFEVITLSHVIEHVPDPVAVLRACNRLLEPGGWIWIETPNLDSQGHARYRESWRGLEIPRHLVLFTAASLEGALEAAGFARAEHMPYRPLCEGIFCQSEAIAAGKSPQQPASPSRELRRVIRRAERVAKKDVSLREFLNVKAWRR